MNKPNDIVMIFGNPVKCQYPDSQARLIEKVSDQGLLEEWLIEFLDNSSRKYVQLIRKQEPVKSECHE